MVQLALYKGKGKIGNALIRWWTRSPYSHCELVVNGVCYSSSIMDGGVRPKSIDLNTGHWELIDLPEILEAGVLAYFAATEGDEYGWIDLLLSQVFNTASDQRGAAFCSEWCAAAIGFPTPAIYSPRTLGELARWLSTNPWQATSP